MNTVDVPEALPSKELTLKEQFDSRFPRVSSDTFRNITTAGAFFIAIVGLFWQSYEQRVQNSLTRELNYDRMWTEYMELSITYPRFAEGPRTSEGLITDYNSLSSIEKVQYQWFFDRLAYTAESILALQPDDSAWVEVFEVEFSKHASLLAQNPNIMPEWFCVYDETVRPFMLNAVEGMDVNIRNCPKSASSGGV